MKNEKLLSRLEELIQDGEKVRATATPVFSGSSQKYVNKELFFKWSTSSLSFLETNFRVTAYSIRFGEGVRSRLSDNTELGLAVLNALKDDISKGYLEEHISAEEQKSLSGNYVNQKWIKELQSLNNPDFDTARLVKLCEELNKCYKNNCELGVAALVRTILNHVPPVFEMKSFEEVANNYSWGDGKRKGESKKGLMIDLEKSARTIADIHLHQEIRKLESLPTMTQVDFINKLDVLLEEIVRILKS